MTIGGCVDAQVVAAADAVLAGARPTLLALSLRDEEGWDLGLTCGGTLRVLIEPVQLDGADDPIASAYAIVRQAVSEGRRAVAVAPLSGDLARLVVHEDGTTVGTLGSTSLDAEAVQRARAVLDRGESSVARLGGSETPEMFFELHAPRPRLLVFGATHVAMPLVAYAAVLEWHTIVIDARDRFATRERFPDADDVQVGNVGLLAEQQHYDAATYVVIVTHDYKFELPILRTVLARTPAYVGLLASRTRARALREFLAADGIDPVMFDRLHVPIGLDVGAQTAAEIALSVLAEIVGVRSGRVPARGAVAARA